MSFARMHARVHEAHQFFFICICLSLHFVLLFIQQRPRVVAVAAPLLRYKMEIFTIGFTGGKTDRRFVTMDIKGGKKQKLNKKKIDEIG